MPISFSYAQSLEKFGAPKIDIKRGTRRSTFTNPLAIYSLLV
jgi:hypothetical protein